MHCFACRKKVGILGFECSCGKVFCTEHRYPFSHNCPIDRKKQCMDKLEKDNIRVRPQKVEKI